MRKSSNWFFSFIESRRWCEFGNECFNEWTFEGNPICRCDGGQPLQCYVYESTRWVRIIMIRIWVVPQILQSVPWFSWDGFFIFVGDNYDYINKTMANFKCKMQSAKRKMNLNLRSFLYDFKQCWFWYLF